MRRPRQHARTPAAPVGCNADVRHRSRDDWSSDNDSAMPKGIDETCVKSVQCHLGERALASGKKAVQASRKGSKCLVDTAVWRLDGLRGRTPPRRFRLAR
jgi:hypothetical protein